MTQKNLLKQFRNGALVCLAVAGTWKLGDLSWNGYSGHCGIKDLKMPEFHNGGNAADDPTNPYNNLWEDAEQRTWLGNAKDALGIERHKFKADSTLILK